MIECFNNDEFLKFVKAHQHENPSDLMLKYSGANLSFDLPEAVTQIDCRRRTAQKLKTFNACDTFYYPSRLTAEQASNESVAEYHASLLPAQSVVADLTSGLGIDAMCMARRASEVHTFDLEEGKTEALRHNVKALKMDNIIVHEPGDSIEYLKHTDTDFDVIYIDPARRDTNKNRVYALSDCTPNVVELLPLLKDKCKILIIKASPMLDITEAMRELPDISAIRAVSWKGECKEVLVIFSSPKVQCDISAVIIDKDGNYTEYHVDKTAVGAEQICNIPIENLNDMYLYEPDASILKLGALANITAHFEDMYKLDTNTNVYVSERLYSDFPGRKLFISHVSKLRDKSLKTLKRSKRNIVCRNFPLEPNELKKRLKLKDGGNDFIYGVTCHSTPIIIEAIPASSE